MKNKTDLLYTFAYLTLCALLFSFAACRTRKVDKDLTKVSTSQVSSSNLDLKSRSLDLSTFQKSGSEKNFTIIVKETFAPSRDPKQPLTRETTISNSEKSNTESGQKNVSQNKAIKATQSQKATTAQTDKKKLTEVKGMSVGQSLITGVVLISISLLLIFAKRIFGFFRYLGS